MDVEALWGVERGRECGGVWLAAIVATFSVSGQKLLTRTSLQALDDNCQPIAQLIDVECECDVKEKREGGELLSQRLPGAHDTLIS
jgi:hypothetical protein